MHQVDGNSWLVDFRHRGLRAGERARSRQTVGTIAPRPDLLVVSGLWYTQPFRGANGAVDARRRCPRTLTIRAVLWRRDCWTDVAASSRQRARANILALRSIRRDYWLCLLSTNWNTMIHHYCAETRRFLFTSTLSFSLGETTV